MAIIKCPECGKEISSYAKECNQCGYPLNLNPENNDYIYICPKCAMVYSNEELDSNKKCRFCNVKAIITKETMDEFIDNMDDNQDYDITLSKKYGGNQFSEDNYYHRLQSIKLENKNCSTQHQTTPQPNLPHCPVCNSTNIEKISLGKKAKGSFLFGFLSSDVRKQMHCKDCGYKF